MKSEAVVDASIVLAVLNEEEGTGSILEEAGSFLLGAVNAAEAQAVLVRSGMEKAAAWAAIREIVDQVVPFDARQAELAGTLILKTKSLGLSLGDRACLALGIAKAIPIYTMDRAWEKLRAGVEIRVMR